MLILYHVCHGSRRFGELRRLLPGISEKMLIQDSRQMQESGLLSRKDYKELPPKVEYSITPFGKALGESLHPISAWGNENRKNVFGKMQAAARLRKHRASLMEPLSVKANTFGATKRLTRSVFEHDLTQKLQAYHHGLCLVFCKAEAR